MTKVNLIIKSLTDSRRQVEADFLVDSGAHFTVVPSSIVEKLGLKPNFEQSFSLADGKTIKRKVGNVMVKFEDREMAVPVVLGERNDEGLLGVTTLESFGLMLDPFQRKIYKSRLMLGTICCGPR